MVLLLLSAVLPCKAQTFDEWFEQNKTRKEYQDQQIGELQIYMNLLEQGYGVVESGLDTIGGYKQAEYDLHNNYYTSLSTVSPAVTGMPQVQEILTLQQQVVDQWSAALTRYNASGVMQPSELTYLQALYGQLLQYGTADVTMLTNVLTDGVLQLTEDQRVAVVLVIDARMRQRYRATMAVTWAADGMVAQRSIRALDARTLSQLYGLP